MDVLIHKKIFKIITIYFKLIIIMHSSMNHNASLNTFKKNAIILVDKYIIFFNIFITKCWEMY